MKKLLFLTLLMLSVVGARAQQPSFIEFFGNYAVREGFTSVELGRRMMQMMTRQAGTDASLAQLLQGISSIRIIVADTLDRDFVAAAGSGGQSALSVAFVVVGRGADGPLLPGGGWTERRVGVPDGYLRSEGNRRDRCGRDFRCNGSVASFIFPSQMRRRS